MASPTEIKISQSDLNLTNAPTSLSGNQVTGILNSVYLIVGIVAVFVIILGGLRYVTSNGDATKVKSAKDTIFYAVIGIVVIIMAAAITAFVGARVQG